ncbi:MAG: glycerophosphodiester phosphodiesterase [Myxococcota bacterium]|nr:glycerophosphodiester phosphodiesterase [Myxococcota bacterium]
MRHPFLDVPVPTVIGHRGAAGELPENTLTSFERALARGAHILETDAHVTRDGALVLIHDDVLERTTNGVGRVADIELSELRRLDAGDRFSPAGHDRFPFRGRGLRIPTLEEALQTFPDARFNIELKERIPALVHGAIDLVQRLGREETVLLAAADDGLMADLRAQLAETRVGVAVGASAGDVLGFVRAALDGKPAPPGPDALQIPPGFGGRPLVTRELVEHAHAYDVAVHVWTVNEPAEMHRLLDLGVDGIISDFPGRVAQVAAERLDRD